MVLTVDRRGHFSTAWTLACVQVPPPPVSVLFFAPRLTCALFFFPLCSQAGNGVAAQEVPTVVTTAITTTTAAVAASAPAAAATPVCQSDSADSASSGLDSADGEDDEDGKAVPLELFLWSYPNQLSPFSGTKVSGGAGGA